MHAVDFRLGSRQYGAGAPTLLMGILNVTPDSFYDGGRHSSLDLALAHGRRLATEGADIIDVGGESTRPGSAAVPAAEEIRRVIPVIRTLAAELAIPLSVDTTKPEVADAALAAGACVINDVRGLRGADDLARIAARHGASLVLMHSRGTPADMQQRTDYGDVAAEVAAALSEAATVALAAGVASDRVLVDPGIGFAKDVAGNLSLLRHLRRIAALGFPVLVGTSRKSFLGAVTGLPVGERLMATAASCVAAVLAGARVLRVHDVAPLRSAVQVADAIVRERAA